ncbi:peroxisome biogenesis factor 2 [Copidosoma floridanum]|uniref:peroxisome biogenesis factor 2 n=1 Tax=Copidosoma floridanum TaxID=29053 RepID=UPI0006C97422|nr:peroxisome biogenesis factor 2 [Copidosoma floridanum]
MSDSQFVSRINQLDAVQLDNEIYKVLRGQAEEVTKYFAPGKAVKWKPEIDVLVKYLIWNYSLKKNSTTFGQQLLNLSYKNLDRRKALLLFVLSSVPNYLRERFINENFIFSRLPTAYQRSRYKGYVDQVDNFLHLLNFIWSFFFLYYGNQSRFVEKILGLRNYSSDMNRPRSIGYSYMTRELLWHGLIELFTIGLPMIDLKVVQRLWNDMWVPKKKEITIVTSCKLESNALCAYCNQLPIFPRWAGCPHVFCYYCLEALFLTMDPYRCPLCNNQLYYKNVKSCLNT